MATYVIGDIHGHFTVLQRLVRKFGFRSGEDRIWLVGDLVNRGPQSLQVLQWAKSLGESLTAVMGNHDLYLLGRALCDIPPKKSDRLSEVLDHPDRQGLIDWLRHRPFVHQEDDRLLVHAGFLPGWNLDEIRQRANQAQAALTGPRGIDLLQHLVGRPKRKDPAMLELARTIGVFTRLRICDRVGSPRFDFVAPLAEVPHDCIPWFGFPGSQLESLQILFGHWSALGYHRDGNAYCLDSGCAHGGPLTALRLEDGRIFQEGHQPVRS